MPLEPKAAHGRLPYTGFERKLVISIDIGTTYSGASYCLFDQDVVPEIFSVNTFDGEAQAGNVKIPTVVYYDKEGNMCGAGARLRFKSASHVDEEEIQKVEWFKTHLMPPALKEDQEEFEPPTLPFGKTIIDVFADFLGFMYQSAKTNFIESRATGQSVWESLDDRIDFVLTHPNGYEPKQQALMRRIAIAAGLVPDMRAALARIRLLTEGEASLHYCLDSRLGDEAILSGNGFVIVDAGGGTIDVSSYFKKGEFFEEIAAPTCAYNGSVYVTSRAKKSMIEHFKDSKYEDDVDILVHEFDQKIKLVFDSPNENYYIQFTGRREKHEALRVKSGKFAMKGEDIETFFEPGVKAIQEAIVDQITNARKDITSVFLVGGFSSSRWLFECLKTRLAEYDLDVFRPEFHANKAVAHGALAWYLDHKVTTRIAKLTYGIRCDTLYNPHDPEHLRRSQSRYVADDGRTYIRHKFDVILTKGTRVSETEEFLRPFYNTSDQASNLAKTSINILCYRGEATQPRWTDQEPDQFSVVCKVEGDMSNRCEGLLPIKGEDGSQYYSIHYHTIMLFGLTTFEAQLMWTEDGRPTRSEASIVTDGLDHEEEEKDSAAHKATE